jgi:hypothetical protein
MKTTNSQKQDIGTLRKQKIANRMAEIPKKYRKTYKKAVETNSKPEAIKAFCLECVCWQKNEIIKCPCLACPLYGLRPYTKQGNPSTSSGQAEIAHVLTAKP